MLGSAFHGAEVVAQRALQIYREKAFWRESVLQGIEECARENQYEKPDMPAASQPRLLHLPLKVRLRPEGFEASAQFEVVSDGVWNYVAQAADEGGYIRAKFNVSDTMGRGFICCARDRKSTDIDRKSTRLNSSH